MKLGCCCKREHISAVKEAGYDYIDLSGQDLMRMSEEEIPTLAQELKEYQISCLAINDYSEDYPSIVGENFDEAAIRSYARTLCSRAAAIGASIIGIGSPNARQMPHKYSYYRAFDQAVRFLKITAEEALAYPGMIVAFEALNLRACNFCSTQQQAVELVKAVHMPNTKIVTDFYHMELMAEPFAKFSDFLPYIGHVHISGKNAEDVRCFFKKNDPSILIKAAAVLKENHYQGTISVEAPFSTFTLDAAKRSADMIHEYLCNS